MSIFQRLHRWLRRKGTPRVIITDGEHSFPAYTSVKDGVLYARTTRGMEKLAIVDAHFPAPFFGGRVGDEPRAEQLPIVIGRSGATWRWEDD